MLLGLIEIIGSPRNERDRSDLRHLAHVAAAGAPYFVSRDERLLDKSDDIEAAFGVSVLRPAQLVIQIDTLKDESGYVPQRIKGSELTRHRVTQRDLRTLVDSFQSHTGVESLASFRTRLSRLVSDPQSTDAIVVLRGDEPVALYVVNLKSDFVADVPVLRVHTGRFSTVIAKAIISQVLETCVRNKYPVTRISDPALSNETLDVLASSPFTESGQGWWKINLSAVGTAQAVRSKLENTIRDAENEDLELPSGLRNLASSMEPATTIQAVSLERMLWPAKLLDKSIPVFVIPIRPQWAEQLFDEELARQTLVNADVRLMLSWENVYYRAGRRLARNFDGPCRVLWYVSRDSRYVGSGQIRACSLAVATYILPAREAFQRFKKRGIYEWKDILALARNDPQRKVMVIRFADTELFDSPITFEDATRTIAEVDGSKPFFQSACRISELAFLKLYCRGVETKRIEQSQGSSVDFYPS